MEARQNTLEHARTLRRQMTLPEVKLWQILRRRNLGGLKFRRQHPMGPWVLDFFCAERAMAVEIDGEVHALANNPDRDARRDAWLKDRGIRVLHVSARQVLENVEGVANGILAMADGVDLFTPDQGPLSHLQGR